MTAGESRMSHGRDPLHERSEARAVTENPPRRRKYARPHITPLHIASIISGTTPTAQSDAKTGGKGKFEG
jgi:hypothetical protein